MPLPYRVPPKTCYVFKLYISVVKPTFFYAFFVLFLHCFFRLVSSVAADVNWFVCVDFSTFLLLAQSINTFPKLTHTHSVYRSLPHTHIYTYIYIHTYMHKFVDFQRPQHSFAFFNYLVRSHSAQYSICICSCMCVFGKVLCVCMQ